MDRKKTGAKASSTAGKHGEKKDENFLTKTAHSIRDKVHELTDDVKEKTHNLTHSNDSKKNKKDKNQKKTGATSKTSSKSPTAGPKDLDSDSDDEEDSPKPTPSPSARAVSKKDNERGTSKPDTSGSKAPRTSAASSTSSSTRSDKLTSKDSGDKSSDDHKDPAASPSAKPSGRNSATESSSSPSNDDSKPLIDKPDKRTEGGDATNKPSSEANNTDQVHISFDGVSTVEDLLDRIDEAVERAKIIVENGQGTVNANVRRILSAPAPSRVDLEKKSVEKVEEVKNKEENEDEPIRINYNEIHKIEDLLFKIYEQPAYRKVILENAPNNPGSVTVQKQLNPPRSVPLTPANSNASDAPSSSIATTENDDLSAPPKSILQTSQDPSSFQDDQIHENIETDQVVNNLLNRVIDDAIHAVPAVMNSKSPREKRQAPQAPNQNDNQLAAHISQPNQKREAPKAPSSTNNHGENVPSLAVSQSSNVPLISITEPADKEGKDDEKEPSDWI